MISQIKSKIKQSYIFDPAYLFWTLITTNLAPSFGLAYTEPLSPIGKFILFPCSIGVHTILFSLHKNIGMIQLLLCPYLALHGFEIVLLFLFGECVIPSDMFLTLATTNASEAGEVLKNLWYSVVIVILLYLPTIVLSISACVHKIYTTDNFRHNAQKIGFMLLGLSFILSFFAKNTNTNQYKFYEDAYPINLFYNLGLALYKYHCSAIYPQQSKNFRFHSIRNLTSQNREIYVLVIGEASRAENWQLYGYDRDTNPKLSQESNLVLYTDALTQSTTTHKSVPIILSSASAENFYPIYSEKSVVDAFKEAGFYTVFLSNQIPDGAFIDSYQKEADYHQNIRNPSDGNRFITQNSYDEAMLPIFENYVKNTLGNLFVVLHTYGSHFNYRERYPPEFSYFKPDEDMSIYNQNRNQLVNAYDNTLRYTDNFLSRVISILKNSSSTTAMFYSSDHGEDMMDDERNRFLHSQPPPTYYQLKIPLFMWFSDNYKTTFPNKYRSAVNNRIKPVSTNSAFHTMLDMASINTSYLNQHLSLVSDEFHNSQRMYLNDHDQPVFFLNTGLKKQDKDMILKRHIYF